MHLTAEQGRRVVEIARATVDSFVRTGKYRRLRATEAYLAENRGVFVTLNTVEEGSSMLRGCIGFPYPVKPLGEAVQEVAVEASSYDPRFTPVRPEELDRIVVEVSVLTVPAELQVKNRKDMPSMVKVGEDGIVISNDFTSGLLLPQVATEQGWGAEEFLNQACMKAGLSPDSWLISSTKVQTFQADIFAEKSPRGEIEQVSLPVS